MVRLVVSALLCLYPLAAAADPPEIVGAKATPTGAVWRVEVTLSHPDTGWEHYADGWEILAPDGSRLGFRELLHPHVDEQPFTRALSGVAIPDGVNKVTIRARCSRDGWSDDTYTLPLTR
ncbi:MAG: hypothetical protein KDA73_17605 [Rhodobacteraceae bacterium]|nr:hypothetical protein [Paracoccaceae bacterium]